jgi:hypothetical protein
MLKQLKKWLQLNFLAMQTADNVNWKMHVKYVIPQLCSVCFAIMAFTPLMTTYKCISKLFTLLISIPYFGEIQQMTNFYHSKLKIRLMEGVKKAVFCMELCKQYDILSLVS